MDAVTARRAEQVEDRRIGPWHPPCPDWDSAWEPCQGEAAWGVSGSLTQVVKGEKIVPSFPFWNEKSPGGSFAQTPADPWELTAARGHLRSEVSSGSAPDPQCGQSHVAALPFGVVRPGGIPRNQPGFQKVALFLR